MSDKDAGGMYRTVRYPRRFVWTGDVPQGEYIEQLGPNEKCVCVAKGKDYDGVSWDAEAAENHTASESWTETFDHHPQYEPEKVAFSEVDRLRAENETLLKRNETLQALLTEERERHAKVQELQQELQAAYNSKGLHLSDPLSDCVRELRTQLTQAWMRLDYATADRIAVLIGDPKPSDHEREDLQPEPDAEWPEVWETPDGRTITFASESDEPRSVLKIVDYGSSWKYSEALILKQYGWKLVSKGGKAVQ